MIKKYFFTAIALLVLTISNVSAQLIYNFSVHQQPYQPLTAFLVLNPGLWDDINFKRPAGFDFEMNWTGCESFGLVSNPKGQFLGIDTTSQFSGFYITDADLEDRGKGGSVSKSSFRYKVDGGTPNRILKIEIFNAGFWRENMLYSTRLDSVNMQMWLYETSNIIELRYGPSQISHASDYFIYGGPVIGFVKEAGLFSLNLDKLYYLRGDPASPTIDSCDSNIIKVPGGLNSFPSEGTVYKFTPLPNSVKEIPNSLNKISVYPTACTDELKISYDQHTIVNYEIISVSGVSTAYKGTLNKGINTIDISNLPQGIYLLHINNAEEQRTARFVKL